MRAVYKHDLHLSQKTFQAKLFEGISALEEAAQKDNRKIQWETFTYSPESIYSAGGHAAYSWTASLEVEAS